MKKKDPKDVRNLKSTVNISFNEKQKIKQGAEKLGLSLNEVYISGALLFLSKK